MFVLKYALFFEHVKIHVFQLSVTKLQHKARLFLPIFPATNMRVIEIKNSIRLLNNATDVYAMCFENVFLRHDLDNLTQLSLAMKHQPMKISLKGAKDTYALGQYLDRVGTLSTSPNNKLSLGIQIIKQLQPIAKIIKHVAIQVIPAYVQTVLQVPKKFRKFKMFHAFYGNRQAPSEIHRDEKDLQYCAIFPFGTLETTYIYLPYCNIKIKMKIGDLIILNSKYCWHAGDIDCPEGFLRYSGVFVNHTAFVNKVKHS